MRCLATFVLAIALALPATAQQIVVDGSSTVHPILREAARRHRDRDIAPRYSGTTAGFRAFCAGEAPITGASRPIDATEIEACAEAGIEFIELTVGVDAIALVVHPDNTWVDHLTLDDLARMWGRDAEGVVTRWSDVRPDWPDRPLSLYGRGQDSGTYDYFTAAVLGEARASRLDYVGSEDVDFLAQSVAADPDGLAFFGIGAFVSHFEELRDVAVDGGDGPRFADVRTVQAGLYRPLTRPLFVYVDAARAGEPQIAAYIEALLTTVDRWIVFTG